MPITQLSRIAVFCFFSTLAFGSDYYVATDGSDENPGTIDLPFATIQHAVDLSVPGSTLYLRGGKYRQSIDLSGKEGTPEEPITLIPHDGESVIIDGTTELKSEWELDEGNVYKATVSQEVTQLFLDRRAMTLARYPNAPAFSDSAFNEHNRLQKFSSSKRRTVIDDPRSPRTPGLAEAGIDFTDCVGIFNFGDFVTGARVVKDHSAGSSTFAYSPNIIPFKNTRGYFFEGGKGNAARPMLDSAEEWAYDETTKTLYFWSDDGETPAGRALESKIQADALTGNAETHDIVIDGLDFFATAFLFASSDRITVKNCDFQYPASSRRSVGDTTSPTTARFAGKPEDRCEDVTVFNCTFENSDGGGLWGENTHNALVENNLFHRIDYAPVGRSGAVNFRGSPGFVYRRNTIDISGEAMGIVCSPTSGDITEPWVIEYSYNTSCGLMETDGSSVYSAHSAIVESVGRYNWFIGNDARDYRWDGHNRPEVLGLHANFYRNVMMADRIKGIATGGDGARLKGDFHEVYNNTGVYKWSDIDVALDKGGNASSLTKNNAADKITGNVQDPAVASHNFFGRPPMGSVLRDPDNWDFRPNPSTPHLIDKGTPTTCSVNGQDIDVTEGFQGEAPDIGAYEDGATTYWIPGRQEAHASMSVPRNGGNYARIDTDLKYLIGLGGASANIHFGSTPDSLSFIASKTAPENIVRLSDHVALEGNTTYYWRVDTVLADDTVVTGKPWSFTTMISREFLPWKNRSVSKGATWVQHTPSSPLIYQNNGDSFDRSAIAYSTEAFQSDAGFTLTVGYTTGSIGSSAGHNFSFGLISTETHLASYKGANPFKGNPKVYSLGVNLTTGNDPSSRGLTFTNGTQRATLDQSGTNVQFGTEKKFLTNESNVVIIEIGQEGRWSYSINGITEASGQIERSFDLTKSYHVAVFGQDDNGDGKAIQHLSIENLAQ